MYAIRSYYAPHLAHDLIGDDNKIPSRSILLVNLEVIEVK